MTLDQGIVFGVGELAMMSTAVYRRCPEDNFQPVPHDLSSGPIPVHSGCNVLLRARTDHAELGTRVISADDLDSDGVAPAGSDFGGANFT